MVVMLQALPISAMDSLAPMMMTALVAAADISSPSPSGDAYLLQKMSFAPDSSNQPIDPPFLPSCHPSNQLSLICTISKIESTLSSSMAMRMEWTMMMACAELMAIHDFAMVSNVITAIVADLDAVDSSEARKMTSVSHH